MVTDSNDTKPVMRRPIIVYDTFTSGHFVSSLSDPLAYSLVAPKQFLSCVYECFPRVFVPAFCIFVCGLFNDAVSITDYVVSAVG
jgi:hypothetical protein